MKRFKHFVSLTFLIAFTASRAQGMPLPWPFPWAKECPVDWTQLEGQYALSENVRVNEINGLQIALQISIVTQAGSRKIRVSQISAHGDVIYEGYADLSENQRIVRLYLTNAANQNHFVLATIKLHHEGDYATCTMDHLVPVLTLDQSRHKRVNYKLLRLKQ